MVGLEATKFFPNKNEWQLIAQVQKCYGISVGVAKNVAVPKINSGALFRLVTEFSTTEIDPPCGKSKAIISLHEFLL